MDGFLRRQRRLGAVFLAVWALIYATIPLVPSLNRTLARFDLAAPVWGSLYGIFLLFVAGMVGRSRAHQTPGSLMVLGGVCVAGGLVAWQLDQPARGLHLVGYGFLGFLGYRFLAGMLDPGPAAPAALAIVGLIGWGDEGIQWLVPRRVYSLGDVGLNLLAALMGVLVGVVWPGSDPEGRSAGSGSASGVTMVGVGLVVVALMAAAPAEARRARSWPTMGTWAEVVLEASDDTTARQGVASVRRVFRRVDRTLSLYREDSDLRRVNRAAGRGPVAVDPWVIRVVRHGRAMQRISGGAFSMNVLGPQVKRGMKPARLGNRSDRPEAGGRIRLYGEPPRVALTGKGMGLDAGGIAKGFALDRAAGALKARGIDRYLIRLGRSVMAGAPPEEDPGGWPVGLPGETEPRRIVHQSIAVSHQPADTGIHLLDPRTGRPVPPGRRALVSARVGWVADAAATALAIEPARVRALMRAYPSIRWTRVALGSSRAGTTS